MNIKRITFSVSNPRGKTADAYERRLPHEQSWKVASIYHVPSFLPLRSLTFL